MTKLELLHQAIAELLACFDTVGIINGKSENQTKSKDTFSNQNRR